MSVDSPCPLGESAINDLQKAVLTIGGIILLANLVFPPWEAHKPYPGGVIVTRMDRAFVASPPVIGQPEVACVDWSLLGATSLAIAVGTGVLFGLTALFGKPKPN